MLIKGYPTTIEEDEKILNGKLTENQKNMVTLRLGEKKIFHYIISTADVFLGLLKLTKKDANLEVNQMEFKDKFDYFKSI